MFKKYLLAAVILFSVNQIYGYRVKVINHSSAPFKVVLPKDGSGRWTNDRLGPGDTWNNDGLTFRESIRIEAQKLNRKGAQKQNDAYAGQWFYGEEVVDCDVVYIITGSDGSGYHIETQRHCH